jgi:hypothetical protein
MLWIAGITSALNSVDNTDGAAGGVTAVAAAGVCAVTFMRQPSVDQPYLLALACALMGACCGFLRYNWPKARIYLGDNGSFLLGFTLACLLLFAKWSDNPIRSAIIPWVLVTVPVLDLVLSTLLRYHHGVVRTLREAIVHCGHDHLAHRLQALGMSQAGASAALWSVGAIAAIETVILCRADSDVVFWSVLAGHAGFVLLIGAILARARVYDEACSEEQSDKARDRTRVLPVRRLQTHIHSHLPILLGRMREPVTNGAFERRNRQRTVGSHSA